MRLRWVWTVLFISLTAATRAFWRSRWTAGPNGAGPGSVIYVAYGTMHQARNAGTEPVRYTVIAIGGDAK
jgi:hypothetical protein